jgi:REP element-mobilizing transposase RayT
MQCRLLAIGNMPDHLHIRVALTGSVSLSALIRRIKGGSSRRLSEWLGAENWHGWQANYAAFSVSPSHVERVKRYIRAQKRHHAAGALWTEAERCFEEAYTDGAG